MLCEVFVRVVGTVLSYVGSHERCCSAVMTIRRRDCKKAEHFFLPDEIWIKIAICCCEDAQNTVSRLFSCSRRFRDLGRDAHTRAFCLLARARHEGDFSASLYKASRTGRVDVVEQIVREARRRARLPLHALLPLDYGETEDGEEEEDVLPPARCCCCGRSYTSSGPLHAACAWDDHSDVLVFLLRSLGGRARDAARARTRDASELTPLHVACREGRPASVRALLSFFAPDPDVQYELLNMEDGQGKTALHHACLPKRHASKTVRAITESLTSDFTGERWRDSLRTVDSESVGCLHYACLGGDAQVIKTLVERVGTGAGDLDPCRIKSFFYGSTLFHWLGDRNTDVIRASRLVRYLLDRTASLPWARELLSSRTFMLHRMAAVAHVLNSRDVVDDTPIHCVCARDDDCALRALLSVMEDVYLCPEACVRFEGRRPHTPPYANTTSGVGEDSDYEDDKAYVVDLNARNMSDFTPLHEAAANGSSRCIRVLLEFARTLLFYRCSRSSFRPPIFIDANARDEDGYTPLMIAVENSHADVVETFLSHGTNIDLNASTRISASTPLDMASANLDTDIVGMLKAAGAK